MPSTHLSLHYHIVFATKRREPWIAKQWRTRLHEYLGGMIRALDGTPIAVGGVADHVHILARLNATRAIASVMREIKGESSKWIHGELRRRAFAWQEGYGAFSVAITSIDRVREYIERQEEHHRTKTFREEYLKFLTRHGIAYDERFLP